MFRPAWTLPKHVRIRLVIRALQVKQKLPRSRLIVARDSNQIILC
jgi:hypothetical protein